MQLITRLNTTMLRLLFSVLLFVGIKRDDVTQAATQDPLQQKVICYVIASAIYRSGDGKFRMEDVDPTLCTHLMYGFAKLEYNEITAMDTYLDLQDEWGGSGGLDGYKRFTALKNQNPDLKVMISLGGWSSAVQDFSKMAQDSLARRTFVKSVVRFLEKYHFDGLDLIWEYPTTHGGRRDKNNFSALLRELRREFNQTDKSEGYLLSAVVSGNSAIANQAYDAVEISKHLDFVSVQSYDYHKYSEGHTFTGHTAPLYRHPLDPLPIYDVNNTVSFWLNAGIPKEKLVLGMALYGQGFTLANAEKNELYAKASGAIEKGPYTRQTGIWGWNEICDKLASERNQWKIVVDSHVMAPYATKNKHWIGYEDSRSIYHKAGFVRKMGLGGAMVWSLDTDDFRGRCYYQTFGLLKAVVAGINGQSIPFLPFYDQK